MALSRRSFPRKGSPLFHEPKVGTIAANNARPPSSLRSPFSPTFPPRRGVKISRSNDENLSSFHFSHSFFARIIVNWSSSRWLVESWSMRREIFLSFFDFERNLSKFLISEKGNPFFYPLRYYRHHGKIKSRVSFDEEIDVNSPRVNPLYSRCC